MHHKQSQKNRLCNLASGLCLSHTHSFSAGKNRPQSSRLICEKQILMIGPYGSWTSIQSLLVCAGLWFAHLVAAPGMWFFSLRVSKDIQYSLRATLDRGAQQSLSECHRTKNRGDFSLSSLYITATEAHQKRDYLLENGFPKESRGKWNLMLDKWINIYDTFSGNMKAVSITAHYAKQKKEKKQQQR